MFPSSGEINFELDDPGYSIEKVLGHYADEFLSKEEFDGLTLTFDAWRLNLRCSNTEPLVRLNIESRGDSDLIDQKLAEIKEILHS